MIQRKRRRAARTRTGTGQRSARALRVIDVHSHFFPDRFLRTLMRDGVAQGMRVEVHGADRVLWTSPRQSIRLGPIFYDVAARLEALDEWGISLQALSLSPPMLYWARPALARDLAAVFNDEMVAICRAHPDRFIALATLPLQDVDAAVAEAERAVAAGCRGISMGTNVNGRYLDALEFTPLYEFAESMEVPIFTHPINQAGEENMTGWHLVNSVGNPGETALAGARLIMAGVLQRFPRLQLILAHGGGTLPFLAGRLDHAYAVRRECQTAIPQAPSAYLRHLYFDTITHDDQALAFLIRMVGSDRVLLGTDYPFEMGDATPAQRLGRLKLSMRDVRAMYAGNAQRLLRIPETTREAAASSVARR